MKTISRLVTLGLLLSSLGQAVSITIMTAGATNKAKIHVQFETKLEPSGDASQTRRLVGGVVVTDTSFHRYIQDRARQVYYGYDIVVDPMGDGSTLRVSILPLSIGPERLHLPDPEKWTALAPPRYPEPQIARLGDTMAFDLFVNPTTGQKVVEYAYFGEKHRMETAIGPAREFAIHDVELEVRAPRFTLNGEPLETASSAGGSIRGHFVILYLRPKGRFVISLVPHPELGFVKGGEVRGSTLTFQADGDTYEVNCEGKIAPGARAYDLYVRHDAAYRPSGAPDAEFFLGSSDAFEGSR